MPRSASRAPRSSPTPRMAASFRLTGVPAGEVTVVVRYTGLQESKTVANVVAGQVETLDFELRVPSYTAAGGGDAVEMDMIQVTAKREGQASAIMERRAAMNAKNVVAADNYGALTMGDVGEFMKSMPGISLDYTEVDATAVRIGGLDPKYSTFTIDGARMATATSNNNSGRQNSFEQMSITGIESIELNNTLTRPHGRRLPRRTDQPPQQVRFRSHRPPARFPARRRRHLRLHVFAQVFPRRQEAFDRLPLRPVRLRRRLPGRPSRRRVQHQLQRQLRSAGPHPDRLVLSPRWPGHARIA